MTPPIVQEYQNRQAQNTRELDTLKRHIRQAYDAAQAQTGESGGLDNLASLVDAETRRAFNQTLISNLTESAVDYFGAQADIDDVMKRDRLLLGYLGTSGTSIENLVNTLKENTNFERFYGKMVQGNPQENIPPMIAPVMNLLNERLADALSQEGAKEQVVEYTQTAGQVNPELLTVNEMAYLIAKFSDQGRILNRDIEEKPYFINPENN